MNRAASFAAVSVSARSGVLIPAGALRALLRECPQVLDRRSLRQRPPNALETLRGHDRSSCWHQGQPRLTEAQAQPELDSLQQTFPASSLESFLQPIVVGVSELGREELHLQQPLLVNGAQRGIGGQPLELLPRLQ